MKQRPPRILLYVCSYLILLGGCGAQVKSTMKEAHDLFGRGDYLASIAKYRQIVEKRAAGADRALLEMGIVYAYPGNEQKNYQKALECFQKLTREYPESAYRLNSEALSAFIHDADLKEKRIHSQQAHIEALERQAGSNGVEIGALKERVDALEQSVFAIQNGPADKILIEKKERRMTLFARNNVLRTYKIALGGNPDGPKERLGDKKTPEGFYYIDGRNKDSRFHLSLHISYPNEKDKLRAMQLGVSPGGDIMIHGLKNGFSWLGDSHTAADWTEGCIAVTNEEIEEIDKLAPNGTTVEIRP